MIINFYGAPGSGKSTISLGLSSFLKSKSLDCEYVGEYIKNLIAIHGDNHIPIFNQLDILVNQNKLIKSFLENSEIVVTDSPILNTLIYIDYSADRQITFCKNYIKSLVLKLNDYYSNQINILVTNCPDKKLYKDSLRNYTYEESNSLHLKFKELPIFYDYIIDGFNINHLDFYQQIYNEKIITNNWV